MSKVFRRRLSHWTYREIVRGEGVYLYDREGRRYLDGSSGAVVSAGGEQGSKTSSERLKRTACS